MNYRLDHNTDIEESEKSNSFESKHGKSMITNAKFSTKSFFLIVF